MKRKNKLLFYGFMVLIFLCHLTLGCWLGSLSREKELQQNGLRLQKEFRRLAVFSDTEQYLQRAARRLFKVCLGLDQENARKALVNFLDQNRFSPSLLEVYFFDRDRNLLFRDGIGAEVAEDCFSRVLEVPYKSSLPHSDKSIKRFLKGPFGLGAMKSRPNTLFKLNNSPRRTWGIWNTGGNVEAGKIWGMMIFVNREGLSDYSVTSRMVRIFRNRGLIAGFWDAFNDRMSGTFRDLDKVKIEGFIREYNLNPDRFPRRGKDLVVVVPGRNGVVFWGVVPCGSFVLPGWIIGSFFLFLAFCFRSSVVDQWDGLPLHLLLGGMVFLAGGLPFCISLWFWSGFEETFRETVTRESLSKLENHLINIDSTFPLIIRKKRGLYQEIFRRMRESPEKLLPILSEFKNLEISGELDSILLIASTGQCLGKVSGLPYQIRRIALLPEPSRGKWLKHFSDKGLNYSKQDLDFLQNFRLKENNRDDFLGFGASSNPGPLQTAGYIGKKVMSEFNRARGIAPPAAGKEDVANLVKESIMDSQSGSTVGMMASFLGNFVFFGSDDKVTLSYIDILPDSSGGANYFGIIFHTLEIVEHSFFEKIFRRKKDWPSGMTIFAVSGNSNSPDFPRLGLYRIFQNYERRLVPPQRMLSEVVRIKGEKFLLAALACRNASHYVLISLSPFQIVENRLREYHNRFIFAGACLSLIMLLLAWRLHSGIYRPARSLLQGIRAMENKNFSHRIPCGTNDEFDDLAETFNATLSGMEEWELATQVQNHLFPAGPVSSGPFVFFGKCISTSQIGGDFFDAVPLENNGISFFLGDVSGHSVSAALVVGMVKATFECVVKSGETSPAEICWKINSVIRSHLGKKKMMTGIAGTASPDGTLLLFDAAHIYPLLLSPENGLQILEQVNLPMGPSRKKDYSNLEIKLPKPSRLLMVTDGILEATNPKGEPVGMERIVDWASEVIHVPRDRVLPVFFARFLAFTQTTAWVDDVTVGVLEFN